MGIVSGLVQQVEQHFERCRILPHRADEGMQVFENLSRVRRQQPVGMLLIHLQSILALSGCNQGVGIRQDCADVVVNREQLRRQRPRLGQTPGLQIGLQQSAQSVGMGIEVRNFLQTLQPPPPYLPRRMRFGRASATRSRCPDPA